MNDHDQDRLLVKRRNDNHSPGPMIRELVPSSHQRSELSNTILCIFSGWDQRIGEGIPIPDSLGEETTFINIWSLVVLYDELALLRWTIEPSFVGRTGLAPLGERALLRWTNGPSSVGRTGLAPLGERALLRWTNSPSSVGRTGLAPLSYQGLAILGEWALLRWTIESGSVERMSQASLDKRALFRLINGP